MSKKSSFTKAKPDNLNRMGRGEGGGHAKDTKEKAYGRRGSGGNGVRPKECRAE